jgi:putative ABC transport system permease protein
MNNFLQDLRYSVRMLLKKPIFTLIALFTLALGIGANTAIFSVVNAVLLRPLPFKDSDRLVSIYAKHLRMPDSKEGLSYPDFSDFREQSQSFQHLTAWYPWDYTVTGEADPERIRGAVVSREFFDVLGVQPKLGHLFTAEEDKPNNHMVLLSHKLWQRRFNSNPNVVGQSIILNGKSYLVAGVMAPQLKFPLEGDPVDVWTTITMEIGNSPFLTRRNRKVFYVMGRLQPNVEIGRAQAELDNIATALGTQYPQTNESTGVKVIGAADQMVGSVRNGLLLLFGAVGCVLLIACVNIANLLLAKATVREREIAVRSALGASRWQIIRLLLTESALLALVGGGLGLLLAAVTVEPLVALSPGDLPRAEGIGLDISVLGFTLLISLVTGVFFGLAPALQSSKTDLATALKEGGRAATNGRSGKRLRNALVVAEMALALILLAGAGLLLNTFWNLRQINPGFDAKNVVSFRISLPYSKYKPPQVGEFYKQLQTRLQSITGVESVSAVFPLPMSGETSPPLDFEIEGRPMPANERPNCDGRSMQPGYFDTLGIRLVKGRDFTERDSADAPPVAIINETLARRHFPNEDPIGKRIRLIFPMSETPLPFREIVGVFGDVKQRKVSEETRPEIYAPFAQGPFPEMYLAVKTSHSPSGLIGAVNSEVHALDKDQPIYDIKTLEQRLGASFAQQRFSAALLTLFAALALILTAVGLYGVISYSVAQRTHEIGLRVALGAQQSTVLKLIVGEGVKLALIGVVIGFLATLGLKQLVEGLLFGVKASDPLTFAVIASIQVLVSLVACYLPARRAAKVDPMVALRGD